MAEIRALNSAEGTAWQAIHGDCVDVVAQLPDASVGFSVYSPPFGNCSSIQTVETTWATARPMTSSPRTIGFS